MRIMTSRAVVFFLCSFIGLIVIGCNREAESRAEQQRQWIADSTREAKTRDSLFQLDVRRSFGESLKRVQQPQLDSAGSSECYRVYVEFSWGASAVGPILALMTCNYDSSYRMDVTTFPEPERKRVISAKELSEADFRELRRFFDSLQFESVARWSKDDGTSYLDATQFRVESYRNGKYHHVTRAGRVDPFVFDLCALMAEKSGLTPKLVAEFREDKIWHAKADSERSARRDTVK